MNSILRILRQSAGFTMIELLVVISVIGVLAVAVLSSLNPIEQINKGRDTRLRSDAGQLLSGIERYFSIHEVYPWNEASTTYTPSNTDFEEPFEFNGETASGNDWNWVDQLATTEEVKPAFTQRLKNDARLHVIRGDGTNASTYVCFAPSSYAFKLEAAKNCANGSTPSQTDIDSQNFIPCSTARSTTPPAAPPTTGTDYICLP